MVPTYPVSSRVEPELFAVLERVVPARMRSRYIRNLIARDLKQRAAARVNPATAPQENRSHGRRREA